MAELSIPIDIHYNKLLDWLINRRHCDAKWLQQIRDIRNKLAKCLSALPNDAPSKISQLKNSEVVDVLYFDCLQIMEYLKTVEPNDTNILGQYTSSRLKEWNDILKSYEKGNLYLAEGGQMLVRQVNYEIAFIKKQISKLQQQQRELSKRANECKQGASNHEDIFQEQCRELTIKGMDICEELVCLTNVLPSLFDEVVNCIESTAKSVEFYKSFSSTVINRDSLESTVDVLPLLSYVIQHGNTSVYQYEHGESPCEEITMPMKDSTETTNEGSDAIDWGNLIEIVEELVESPPQDTSHVESSANDVGIDFDVDVDLSQIVLEGTGEETQESNNTGPTELPNKSKYPTILEDFEYRNKLLNDVMELQEFLKQRNLESMSEEDDPGLLMISGSLPEALQAYSSADVSAMIVSTQLVIDKMTEKKLQHVLLLLDSPSYLERLSSQLLQHKHKSKKLLQEIEDCSKKAEELNDQQLQLEEKLKWHTNRTKDVQKNIAAGISKLYKNRKVNIIGEISQI